MFGFDFFINIVSLYYFLLLYIALKYVKNTILCNLKLLYKVKRFFVNE